MNQYDKVTKNIFGKNFELKIHTDNYDFDNPDKVQPLLDYEIEEVNWMLNYNLSEDIKQELIDMFNDNYDSIGMPRINNIYPEAEFTALYVCKRYNKDVCVGILGECASDPEHGFSLFFSNKKFYSKGKHSDLF